MELEWIANIVKLIIAFGIYNVWLFRFGRPSKWRGGTAKNMKEEFAVYGLPDWFIYLIGGLKLLGATLLILGIWYPQLTNPAAILIGVLMLGAIGMHLKVSDPLKRSLPAFLMFVMCVFVVFS